MRHHMPGNRACRGGVDCNIVRSIIMDTFACCVATTGMVSRRRRNSELNGRCSFVPAEEEVGGKESNVASLHAAIAAKRLTMYVCPPSYICTVTCSRYVCFRTLSSGLASNVPYSKTRIHSIFNYGTWQGEVRVFSAWLES